MKRYIYFLLSIVFALALAGCGGGGGEEAAKEPEATEAPTEAPTEALTEAPTEAPTEADYSAYMGEWYSGSVTFIVKEEKKWVMQEKGETFIAGHFVFDDNGNLIMYDVEGLEVARILPEDDGTLYAELYVEEMYNRVDDFVFTREQSEGFEDVIDDGGDSEVVG